ncbi:MAG: nucleoside hydrolase [Brevibacterium sp.]
MPNTIPLFLDCDPGIDDAVALGYLLCQDDIDTVGIAASGGNVPTAQVARNTRGWLELAGRGDIPVHAGHPLPLAWQSRRTASEAGPEAAAGPVAEAAMGPHRRGPVGRDSGEPARPEYADLTHGVSGTGHAQLPEPAGTPNSTSAAQAWVDAARAHPGELIGVVIGPATNLALAIDLDPELPGLLKRLFIMGGAFNYRGNTHPTTEWNVTFDPESTSSVLAAFGRAHTSGTVRHLPVIAPIEATEAVEMTPDRLQSILSGAAAGPWSEWLTQLAEALRFYFEFHESDGFGYIAHIHDPFVLACALAWARGDASANTSLAAATGSPNDDRPSIPNGTPGALPWATSISAPVDVELTGTLTRGETVADWLGRWGKPVNAEIIRSIDAQTFLDYLGATLMKGPSR